MDIRWKNSLKNNLKNRGLLYILAAGAAAAAIAMLCYKGIGGQAQSYLKDYQDEEERAAEEGTEYLSMEEYLGDGCVYDMYRSSYVLYEDLAERKEGFAGDAEDIFLPSLAGSGADEETKEAYRSALEGLLENWTEQFLNFSSQVSYLAVDEETKDTVSNILDGKDQVQAAVSQGTEEAMAALKAGYGSGIILSYGPGGDVEVAASWNLDAASLYRQFQEMRYTNPLSDYLYGEEEADLALEAPRGMKVFFGLEPMEAHEWIEDDYWLMYQAYSGSFSVLYMALFVLAVLGAAAVAGRKKAAVAKEKLYHLPVEAAACGVLFAMNMYEPLLNMCMGYLQGKWMEIAVLNSRGEAVLTWLVNFLAWTLTFGILFWAAACLAPVLYLGLGEYVRTHSVIYRFFPFIHRKWRQFADYVTDVDLTEGMEKSIRKITLVNGVVVVVLCVMWFGGIFGAVVYSVALYIFLRKYFTRIRSQYLKLLGWVKHMAQGDLNSTLEEDTGVFNPLREELSHIQAGFKQAVDEEVKSQKLKTELITNVSHDLKTPLTAIITYVDLLKREDLTEEERASYIRILEKKSQRLKVLIEDLFEVSKATTNNVQMHIEDVDLVNLIKQVRFEMEDKLQESGLDFRFQLPEEKVILPLDSQKMYRVIENLMNNIVKYGLKGSRVYIDLKRQENGRVIATFKNISATELNFDPSEITERFVRGDLSRNTEGSGLGLAIARSFVELQGGTLTIDIDGGLFKAIIIFEPKEG